MRADHSLLRALVATLIALPGFAPLSDQKPDNPQRSQRVQPPSVDKDLSDQAGHDDDSQPAASDAFDWVGAERATAQCIGQPKFPAREDVHDRYGSDADYQTRQ
jgi:hypothetical protein